MHSASNTSGECLLYYGSRNVTLRSSWVPASNSRATIDGIWRCAFTVFLSSGSIHLLEPAGFQWQLLAPSATEIQLEAAESSGSRDHGPGVTWGMAGRTKVTQGIPKPDNDMQQLLSQNGRFHF
jgi:hypothetical protein